MSGESSIKTPAGFWLRMAAFCIDAMLVGAVVGVISVASVAIESDSPSAFIKNLETVEKDDKQDVSKPVVETPESIKKSEYKKKHDTIKVVAWLIVSLLYNVGFNVSRFHGTLGKYALSLQVCDINGQKIGLLRSIIRSLATYLSAIPLGIGFMFAGWNKQKRALHDFIAGTQVLLVKR